MRSSRTALSLTALAAAVGTAVLALSGGSSANVAAPAPAPSVSAPVAAQPQVVAQAVVAPHHATTATTTARPVAPPKKAATRPVARPVTKPVAKRTVTAKPAAKPVAAKPTTTVRTGNDYPYRSATTNENDQWGFTERQCVSFAAWRLARAGHAIRNSQGYGSAFHWDEAARANGVRVSSTPHVGSIAQWNVGEAGKVWVNGGQGTFHAGEYGHVGYVAAVYSDGSALIEQYNVMGDRNYTAMRMTAPRYLF